MPAWVMNLLITQDAVQFLKRLGKEAKAQKGKQARPAPAFVTPVVDHLVRDGGPDAGPPIVTHASRRRIGAAMPLGYRPLGVPVVRVRRPPVA